MTETSTILDIVQAGGVIGMLLVVLMLLLKPRKWGLVPYWTYEESVNERDEWKRLALRGTDLADKGVDVAHHTFASDRDLSRRLELLERTILDAREDE